LRHLDAAVAEQLNLDDEWEYRRLLELLSLLAPERLPVLIERGRSSPDAESRNAAEDWSDPLQQ
jgi:hypothetical protein